MTIPPPTKTQALDPSLTATIHARSEKQAMDWSVALLSQGIESVPVHEPDGWHLLVAQQSHSRALAVLDLYRRENRRWLWRPSPLSSTLLFHGGALVWGGLILFIDVWSRAAGPAIRDAGLMNSQAVQHGQWWRLFTATTLHADLAHLAGNLVSGTLLLGFAMARWNAGTVLLAVWFAGALGNLASLAFHSDPYLGLGASGMVMGALGLLATASWQDRTESYYPRRLLTRGLFAAALLFILLGVNPGSDVVAHLGGFVAGSLLGLGFASLPQRPLQHATTSLIAGVLTASCLIWTWSLALLHKP
jgi:membrane associated rhomboid family serine protease